MPTSNQVEPQWHDVIYPLPSAVRHWLFDHRSLTQRLIRASDNNFRVQVLQQCWQRPRYSEARFLAMPERRYALVREVVLRCYEQPWVFARSVLPVDSLTGSLYHLRRWGSRSLGALLFRDSSSQRLSFQWARLAGRHTSLPVELRQTNPLWRGDVVLLLLASLLWSVKFFYPPPVVIFQSYSNEQNSGCYRWQPWHWFGYRQSLCT